MRNQRFPLEMLVPRLKKGSITVSENEISFRREGDGHVTSFGRNCLPYLQSFFDRKNIQTTIAEGYTQGHPPVFSDLKETLMKLYWSDDLENKKEFSQGIEMSDWIPTEDSSLLRPLLELNYDASPLLVQVAMLSLSLGAIGLFFWLAFAAPNFLLTLIFLPQAFLNLLFMASALVNRLLGSPPARITWKISPLGIFLDGDYASSTQTFSARWIHFSLEVGLGVLGAILISNMASPPLSQLGVRICLLLTAILLSPAHNSAVATFHTDLQHKKSFGITATYFCSATAFAFLAFFLFVSTLKDLEGLISSGQTNSFLMLGNCILSAALVGFAFDLVDNIQLLIGFVIGEPGVSPPHAAKKNKEALAKQLLKQIPAFVSLPDVVIERMAQNANLVNARQASLICKEGQPSTELYVILKGKVGIFKRNEQNGSRERIVELGEGSIFGEVGFFCNLPRTGDVVALVPTKLLRLTRPQEGIDLAQPVLDVFQKRLRALQALVHSQVFSRLPSEILMAMTNGGEVIEVPPDNIVMHEGSIPDSVWVLIQGECRFYSKGKNQRILNRGDVMGEIGVVWNSLRTGTVATTQTSIFLRIDALIIRQLLSMNLNLGLALEDVGNQRLVQDIKSAA